jgi:hypothetical protein
MSLSFHSSQLNTTEYTVSEEKQTIRSPNVPPPLPLSPFRIPSLLLLPSSKPLPFLTSLPPIPPDATFSTPLAVNLNGKIQEVGPNLLYLSISPPPPLLSLLSLSSHSFSHSYTDVPYVDDKGTRWWQDNQGKLLDKDPNVSNINSSSSSTSNGNYIVGTHTNLLGSSTSHGGNSSSSNSNSSSNILSPYLSPKVININSPPPPPPLLSSLLLSFPLSTDQLAIPVCMGRILE